MKRAVAFALVIAALAALILTFLEEVVELLAWEVLLLLLLVVLFRLFPSSGQQSRPPLFSREQHSKPRPPRSITSYELAATQAMTEVPGADRRLRSLMRRILDHRLGDLDPSGLTEEGLAAGQTGSLIPRLLSENREPLTASEIEGLVDELERL